MKFNGLMRTGVAVVTLAVMGATTFAPMAEAGNGHGRGKGRYKNRSSHSRVVYHRDRVVHRRSDSNLGPAIIGFIGGVAVGAAINSGRDRYYERDYDYGRTRDRDYGYRSSGCSDHGYSHARGSCGGGGYARAEHVYYDPYCEERFASFDDCRSHQRSCGHPKVIQVVVASSGQCVDTYRYRNGGWRDCD